MQRWLLETIYERGIGSDRKEWDMGIGVGFKKIWKSNPQTLKSPTHRKPITEKKKTRGGKGLVWEY